ncbi:non-ribosomal peptide synthetase, partial [Streptomyces decoyicus]|uniref:non-ribosomal peptide synthetase n=1 Tax=Streptomyces decoyicus TaxID=249567 RepID=UPI0033BC386A
MPEQLHQTMPLSSAQMGVWLAQQLSPEDNGFNVCYELALRGWLDVPLLERAVHQTLREAETTQAVLVEGEHGPLQTIRPLDEFSLRLTDVSAEESPAQAVRDLTEAARIRRVDLSETSVEVVLFRLSADQHVFVLHGHHLFGDGFSAPMVIGRIAEIYAALHKGDEPAPTPFYPLRDVLDEDIAYRASDQFREDQEFWRGRLAEASAPVTLSGKIGRTSDGDIHQSTGYLSHEDFRRLAVAARAARSTWSGLLTTAYAVYVHRLTGSSDVTVEFPVPARSGPVNRRTPGMLSNVLPLILTVAPGTTVSECVREVSGEVRRLLRHQRYRPEDIRRDLRGAREDWHAGGPRINIMPFAGNVPFGNCEGTLSPVFSGPVPDLSVDVTVLPDESGLRFDFKGNRAGHTADDVAAHQRRFLGFLMRFAADPERTVGEIELLSAEEKHQVAVWSGATRQTGTASDEEHHTITEMFEAQARQTPDATALVFEDVRLTYGELNAQANRLAHHLIERGAGPERFVALALSRSAELVVAVLAVLKSGAAYLPIDPDYPAERIAGMLADTGPALVLADGSTASRLPAATEAVRIDDDMVIADISRRPATPPEVRRSPDQVAYVIYTSGSTGMPKGVVIPHRNVIRLLRSTDRWFGFGPDDVWTLFHSYAFDFSVWEIWGALLKGGRLVVVPYDTSRSPAEVRRLLAAERVTVLNQTPSAFYQLIQADQEQTGDDLALRYVIFGGEALEPAKLAPWYARHAGDTPTLVNMYGITETTVHVTYRPLAEDSATADLGSVIGVGIPDLRTYVLDAGLRPVPVGVAGELFVAGAGLARGYLG